MALTPAQLTFLAKAATVAATEPLITAGPPVDLLDEIRKRLDANQYARLEAAAAAANKSIPQYIIDHP